MCVCMCIYIYIYNFTFSIYGNIVYECMLDLAESMHHSLGKNSKPMLVMGI